MYAICGFVLETLNLWRVLCAFATSYMLSCFSPSRCESVQSVRLGVWHMWMRDWVSEFAHSRVGFIQVVWQFYGWGLFVILLTLQGKLCRIFSRILAIVLCIRCLLSDGIVVERFSHSDSDWVLTLTTTGFVAFGHRFVFLYPLSQEWDCSVCSVVTCGVCACDIQVYRYIVTQSLTRIAT